MVKETLMQINNIFILLFAVTIANRTRSTRREILQVCLLNFNVGTMWLNQVKQRSRAIYRQNILALHQPANRLKLPCNFYKLSPLFDFVSWYAFLKESHNLRIYYSPDINGVQQMHRLFLTKVTQYNKHRHNAQMFFCSRRQYIVMLTFAVLCLHLFDKSKRYVSEYCPLCEVLFSLIIFNYVFYLFSYTNK